MACLGCREKQEYWKRSHTKKKIQTLSGHVFCQIDPWAKHGARRGTSAIHSKEISADGLCRFWICAVEEVGLTGHRGVNPKSIQKVKTRCRRCPRCKHVQTMTCHDSVIRVIFNHIHSYSTPLSFTFLQKDARCHSKFPNRNDQRA